MLKCIPEPSSSCDDAEHLSQIHETLKFLPSPLLKIADLLPFFPSESMEDSFSVRVERVFGSLSSSPSSSKPLISSSLWSLTDEEIEKKEWSRETEAPDDADGDGASLPSDVDGFFANRKSVSDEKRPKGFGLKELEADLQSLDDEAKESGAVQRRRSRVADEADAEDENDEWEIRNSIGMDCTLDYEEEEDKYDKVAVGDEERGDRIYMREINDYGIHVSSFNEIPSSFREAGRDPRANHLAAKLRLKEDEEAAENLSPLRVSSEIEMSTQDDPSSSFAEKNHLKLGSDEMIMGAQQNQNNASEAGKQVKSILKRKEDQMGSTTVKKVRFVPDCKEDSKEGVVMVLPSNREESCSLRQDPSVPDYLCNPSKYTCYTFNETDDLDEKSNQQGFMDFLNVIRKTKKLESDEPPADLSQRVIFNPKRKARDASMENSDNKIEQHKDITVQDSTKKKSLPVIIADEAVEESDVCEMEEDSPQMEANRISSRNRTYRQYRSKIMVELDESGP